MVLCLATNRFPTIHLTDEEQRCYDQASNELLKRTLHAYHEEQRPDLKKKQWAHVRRRDKMDVYRNIEGSSNPRVTLYVGKGLMRGTVEDMMDGLYCDTTEDLRKVKTLLNYKFIDGAVFQVSQRRSPDDPFRFAGIKWFAAKAPLGPLVADRDMLNYEVGTRAEVAEVRMRRRLINVFFIIEGNGASDGRAQQRVCIPQLPIHRAVGVAC
ncbi:hypothetical protein ON010_g4443 [Phytophthora cinnamomi]|nr:hypothetical protein ON010_g4443 [Phytophthora cinnamomi]